MKRIIFAPLLLLFFVTISLAQDSPGWWPGPSWCDDPVGSPTGTGWRPKLDSPAGDPFKYKHLFENWQDPVDINGNPIPPDKYYIGACPPKREATTTPPSAPGPLLVKEMLTCGLNKFLAMYYPNMNFTGSPTWVACEDKIAGDPVAPNLPVDQFSVRWSGLFSFPGGSVTFTATTDDGIRVFVDGKIIIDKWFDQGPTAYIHTMNIPKGHHVISVDFYENGGGAEATLVW